MVLNTFRTQQLCVFLRVTVLREKGLQSRCCLVPVRDTTALSIRGHHLPGMQNRARTMIQLVNHKVRMEYNYLKTLLGNPTPLLGQICAITV